MTTLDLALTAAAGGTYLSILGYWVHRYIRATRETRVVRRRLGLRP